MLDQDPAFRPLGYRAGYLPIEDFSLIGEGGTCALVASRAGAEIGDAVASDRAELVRSAIVLRDRKVDVLRSVRPLGAWSQDRVPLEHYPAGSDGPVNDGQEVRSTT